MVVILVIGVPVLELLLLWKWAHPFQRLYVPSEEGEWLSNPTAKRLLGALYSTYKPEAYMGALANTLIKLLLTAVVGLAFNEAQGTGTRRLLGSTSRVSIGQAGINTCVRDETSQLSLTQESLALPLCPLAPSHLRPTPGMLISAFFCFGLCFVFTMATPFIYGWVRFTRICISYAVHYHLCHTLHWKSLARNTSAHSPRSLALAYIYESLHTQGNALSVLSYVSLTAQYIEGASRIARAKSESIALRSFFETVVLILYVLPFAIGAMDLLRFENLLARFLGVCKCQRIRRCFVSRDDAHSVKYAKEGSEHRVRDANRTRCIAQFFDDLQRVGGRNFHNNATPQKLRGNRATSVGSGTGNDDGEDGGMQRRARQRDQTAAHFKKISQSTEQYMDAVNAAVLTLRTTPLSLSWQHLIEMEDCARSLSHLAFSATAPKRASTGSLRTVALSFQNVRGIWKAEVMRGMCEDGGEGNDLGAVASMSGVVACRNAIIAMLVPGSNMGRVSVGRHAAMESFQREKANNGGGTGNGESWRGRARKRSLEDTTELIKPTAGAVKRDGEGKGGEECGMASPLALVVGEGQREDTLDDTEDAKAGDDSLRADASGSKRGQASTDNTTTVPKLRMTNVYEARTSRVDTPRKEKSTVIGGGGLLGRGRSRMPAAVKKAKTEVKKARLDALVARLAALGLDLKRRDPSAVPAQTGSAISLKSLARYIVDGEEDLGWAVQFVKERRGV